jgi:hypothetical protein
MRTALAIRGILYGWLFSSFGWVAIYFLCRLIRAGMR